MGKIRCDIPIQKFASPRCSWRGPLPTLHVNKVARTFAFGREAGATQGAAYDEEMLFLGSTLHDLGLVEAFISEDRFEIDGADATADFLLRQGYPDG